MQVAASQQWRARWCASRHVLLPHAVQVAAVLDALLGEVEAQLTRCVHVVVHRATGLQDMATFGAMDP